MRSFFRRQLAYLDRPVKAGDAAACARLHAESFFHGWSVQEFENLIAAPTSISDGSFAAANNDLLAFVVSRLVADEAEILTIATARSARRKGIAGSLLETHVQTLARAGARKLLLEVADDNHAALALYRKFDFRPVGSRPAYYRRENGQTASAQIMQLVM